MLFRSAIEYVGKHPGIAQDFEVIGPLLDDFQVFLSQRNIQPGVGDWSRDRDIIRNRLKAEVFNQAFGVEKGDEVEAQRDPVIQKALEAVADRANSAPLSGRWMERPLGV